MAVAGDGAGRLEANGGEQGTAAKAGTQGLRRHAAGTGSALYVGAVASAHLRGVCAPAQQVRRLGATSRVHHRAGNGAGDTGRCRRANNFTRNRTDALPP